MGVCGAQLRDEIRGTLLDEGYVIMDLEPELAVTNLSCSGSEELRRLLKGRSSYTFTPFLEYLREKLKKFIFNCWL